MARYKKPTKSQYNKQLLSMVSNHYYECATCGYPVHSGWMCNHCESSNPREFDEKAFKKLSTE